jgi:hypothetical protein
VVVPLRIASTRTDLRRTAHAVAIERLVQLPPQILQNFWEVFRWRAGDVHAARKRAIEVGVRTNLPRHQQHPAGVPRFIVGIGGAYGTAFTNGVDRRALVTHGAIRQIRLSPSKVTTVAL